MSIDYQFRPLRPEEATAVFALYRSMIGLPRCPWDNEYPSRKNVDEDLADHAIYCLQDGENIIAAATVKHCTEHDALVPWKSQNPCDLMRICVAREYQGCGIGARFLAEIFNASTGNGFDAVRILVYGDNLPAVRLYRSAGAIFRGTAFAHNTHWECYEWLPKGKTAK